MSTVMRPGDVFLAGDYAERLESGELELPEEAKSGTYALGTMIMVSRDSLAEDYRVQDLPQWFPARVCLPPPVEGQWYRWYDPFIWYETEIAIHHTTPSCPDNVAYVGKLWSQNYAMDKWAYPVTVWRELFSQEARND